MMKKKNLPFNPIAITCDEGVSYVVGGVYEGEFASWVIEEISFNGDFVCMTDKAELNKLELRLDSIYSIEYSKIEITAVRRTKLVEVGIEEEEE